MTPQEIVSAFQKVRATHVYHITHIDNLGSIFTHGLLPNSSVKDRKIRYRDIAEPGVQDRRSQVEVRASADGTERSGIAFNLHGLAPLYFNPRNAMTFLRGFEGYPICMIEYPIAKLIDGKRRFFFSDGNMASAATRHFCDLKYINEVKWPVVFGSSWTSESGASDPELKRVMCAELNMAPEVPNSSIDKIFVAGKQSRTRALRYTASSPETTSVEIRPQLFFQFADKIDHAVGDLPKIS